MKRIAAVVAVFGVVWVAWSQARASATPATPAACSLRSLRGDFGYSAQGTNPLGQPFGVIGTFTSDGAGTINGHRISADNGVHQESDFSCTYTMNADCEFTTAATCLDPGEVVSEVRLDGVVTDGGREALLLLTAIPSAAGGAVVVGVARER